MSAGFRTRQRSNSARSISSISSSKIFGCVIDMMLPPVHCSTRTGSLTLLRFFGDDDDDGKVGGAGCCHAKRLVIEPRQSGEVGRVVLTFAVSASRVDFFCFVVPSASSSSVVMPSKRFRVSSEGRTEDGKRACGRRYHSAGTQNRNVGFWREFAKDDRMRSDNTDEDEIFEADKEAYDIISEQYI
jgi:hypothetical protein